MCWACVYHPIGYFPKFHPSKLTYWFCIYSFPLSLLLHLFTSPLIILCHGVSFTLSLPNPPYICLCFMSYDHHVVIILMWLILLPMWLRIPLLCVCCMNGWCLSLNEVCSLEIPPGESPSPSPALPLKPCTQIQKENHIKKDKHEGRQSASPPCIEIHTAGKRRRSEPLPSSLPQPQAEPPRETVIHLMVTSEQRS